MGLNLVGIVDYTKKPRLHCIDCGEWLKTWNDKNARKLWCSNCRGLKIGGFVNHKDKMKVKKVDGKIIGAFER